jgi:antitoxin (DNA-binding transcriptional repressor) of toxin-antitoxin stability system
MKSARTLAVGVAVVAVLSLATPAAHADTSPLPVVAADTPQPVIAADTTPAPGTRPVTLIGVDPDIVNGLTVTGHKGRTIKATAKGQRTRIVTTGASTPAVLKPLTPGVSYTITIGGRTVAKATPVAGVGPASNLIARITPTPGQVHLTWSYTPRRAEGANVVFSIAATPKGPGQSTAIPLRLEASGTEATLDGLDPDRLYTITVTPRNTASTGRATSATMSKTLNEITGTASAPAAPTAAVPTTPTPTATPAPAPAPAPAPGPAPTKTIYVCPDGYPESPAGTCQKTLAYTFHTETVTLAYTYHNGVIGSHVVTHPHTHCDYLPNPNSPTGLDIYCTGGYDETVLDYGNVKDATPTGYTDTGTAWIKDIEVKDATPIGYTDNGTAWVKTVGKVAQVVPA